MIEEGRYLKPKKSSEKMLNEAVYITKTKDIGDILLEEQDALDAVDPYITESVDSKDARYEIYGAILGCLGDHAKT